MKKTISAKFMLKGDKSFRKNQRYTFTIERGLHDDVYISVEDGVGRAYVTVVDFLTEWTNIKQSE